MKTKERLKECAIRLFANNGIEGTSIRDIAAQLKLTEGAFYRHYKSKNSLVEEIFLNAYYELGHELEVIIEIESNQAESLAKVIKHLCGYVTEKPELFRFMMITQHHVFSLIPKEASTPYTVLQDFFQKGIDENKITFKDPNLGCNLVFGTIIQAYSSEMYGRNSRSIEQTCSDFIEVVNRAVFSI